LDLPQDRLVGIFGARFTSRIDTIIEGSDFTITAFGAFRSKTCIVRRLDAQTVYKTIPETVSDIDMVGINPVAVPLDNFDISSRGHTAGLLVIGNLVSDQPVAVILDTDLS